MKICVLGSMYTDKTNVARYFATKLSIPLISEVSKQVLVEKNMVVKGKWYESNVFEYFHPIQESMFLKMLSNEYSYNEGVFDSHTIESLAYMRLCRDFSSRVYEILKNIAINSLRTFNEIVFCKLSNNVKDPVESYIDRCILDLLLECERTRDIKSFFIYREKGDLKVIEKDVLKINNNNVPEPPKVGTRFTFTTTGTI